MVQSDNGTEFVFKIILFTISDDGSHGTSIDAVHLYQKRFIEWRSGGYHGCVMLMILSNDKNVENHKYDRMLDMVHCMYTIRSSSTEG